MEEIDLEEEKEKRKLKKKALILFGVIILLLVVFALAVLITSSMQGTIDAKPIIYLYPDETTEVNVKLVNEEHLTHTYPKYTSEGWTVLAEPNGDLTDINTGRNLYALYWEGKDDTNIDLRVGFVFEGNDTIDFLEEKLELLGLNEREAEEFIVYWLPRLENNKYNFVYFATGSEVDNNMPLEVTPKPDTSIRILMKVKALNKEIEVEEQKIVTPIRKGFTLVEWGGAIYE